MEEGLKKLEQNLKWAFLTQAASENEANIIESVLLSEGIPVMKKYQEAGEYLVIYMGMTNFGVDIYVPENKTEIAKTLLTNEFEQEFGEGMDDV
ncbi:MAG: hypothetical protein GX434_13985 [Peptococcaceae bacterium]|nr:hypothetical protein [Peptococcaceae bacterium]